MKILIVCMLVHELRATESSVRRYGWWQERWEPDRGLEPEKLADGEAAGADSFVPEAGPEQRKRVPADDSRASGSAWIRSLGKASCSCDAQYEIRDLGDGHYPRYLTAARCKPRVCQTKFYACGLLHYMVHVLRRREAATPPTEFYLAEDRPPETPLPDSLRHKWRLEPISVAVACVADLNVKRN